MATIDWSLDWKFKKCIEGIEGDAIEVDVKLCFVRAERKERQLFMFRQMMD